MFEELRCELERLQNEFNTPQEVIAAWSKVMLTSNEADSNRDTFFWKVVNRCTEQVCRHHHVINHFVR